MKVLTRTSITPTLVHLQIQREGTEIINALHRAAAGIAFVSPKEGGKADVVVDTRNRGLFLERLEALNEMIKQRFGAEAAA